MWENSDSSAVINSVYFLVLDWIAFTLNTNRNGVQVNRTPNHRFLEDMVMVPWCAAFTSTTEVT